MNRAHGRSLASLLSLVLAACGESSIGDGPTRELWTVRVSLGTEGIEANGPSGPLSPNFQDPSREIAISSDGRFVAFSSIATNLDTRWSQGAQRIYLRDRSTGTTELISASQSYDTYYMPKYSWPSISDDGRYVAFQNGRDVLLRDRQEGKYQTFVSRGSRPSLSAEGRYLAFESELALVPEDRNGYTDIYVKDLQSGSLIRASLGPAGAEPEYHCLRPSISGDGRYVAFVSDSWAFGIQVWVRDLREGTTHRASKAIRPGVDPVECLDARISRDGRFVVFALDLGSYDWGGIYLRDLKEETTQVVSAIQGDPTVSFAVEATSASLSADGRYVAFSSEAPDLTPDANTTWSVFVRDMHLGLTQRVSVSSDGTPATEWSTLGEISGDGRHVAFLSGSGELVPEDKNGVADVFVRGPRF